MLGDWASFSAANRLVACRQEHLAEHLESGRQRMPILISTIDTTADNCCLDELTAVHGSQKERQRAGLPAGSGPRRCCDYDGETRASAVADGDGDQIEESVVARQSPK